MAGTDSSQTISFETPAIILKETQLAENVGMVMRTMLNFGFKSLRLVSPKINWPDPKAISSSAGAYDIIGNQVKVEHVKGETIGKAVDIEKGGSLIIENEDGIISVNEGDVIHLRKL